MAQQYSISESEWKILEVLWEKPNSMVADIVEALSDSGWQYSTIRTLTTRLLEKGYLTAQKEGKYYRYTACIAAIDCRRDAAENMLTRVFGGSVAALVSALAGSDKVSAQEKAELEALVNSMEG